MAITLNTKIVVISIFFSVLATCFVCLRFYCRRLNQLKLEIDDYLIIPALAFTVGVAIANAYSAIHGNLGGHVTIGPEGIPVFDKSSEVFLACEWAVEILSILNLAFTKLSIICFYRRIFRGKTFNLITWCLIALIISWGISFFLATLLECVPIAQTWNTFFGEPGRTCYNVVPMYLATAGSNFACDVLILSVPWPNIWALRMPLRRKFAVGAIFMLGALVCGVSIARLIFFVQAGKAATTGADEDFTYYFAPTLYWTQLEGAFAVICACLPTLRPLFMGISLDSLFDSLRSRLRLSSVKSSTKSNSYSGLNDDGIELDPRLLPSSSKHSAKDHVVTLIQKGRDRSPNSLESGIMVENDVHQSRT